MRPKRCGPPDSLPENGRSTGHEPAARGSRRNLGVLVVDDDYQLRIVTRVGLERDGFDVWLASNCGEAIDLYQKHKDDIDVVLLDIGMPGLDGLQTLDALRQMNPDVSACFMSGDTGMCLLEEMRARGAAHVIAKPFYLHQLAEIVRGLADGAPLDFLPSGGVCQA